MLVTAETSKRQLVFLILLRNILSRRKQKNTLDGLNNNIEVGYSNLVNISKLTELEENKFRQLKQNISKSSETIKKLGKRLVNT